MIILVFNEALEMIHNGIHFTNEYLWNKCSNCNNRTLVQSGYLRCKCGSVSMFKNNITTILCA